MNMQEILRTARIMIVDDDDDLRHVLLTQLEREGVVSLEQAATMAAAFDKIDNFAPDILILDASCLMETAFIFASVCANRALKSQLLCSPARMPSRKSSKGWIQG